MEPIPIEYREDKYIKICGVPHDLTEIEAEKISKVIKAMVKKDIEK